MNYEEMSDFQINQAVTCEVNQCRDWAMNKDGSFYHCGILGESYVHQEVIDYCNNPSDAWPIIFANKIRVSPVMHMSDDNGEYLCTGEWEAGTLWSDDGAFYNSKYHAHSNENPLRSAMVVFLMMKGAECQKS